ncbi:hypothetical protein B0H14DRAFT_2681812 [Mycena olivaceomarginata]|nr:hypothetical protein B0H14DRAFT_2681812 [Mycena olivaceomarginata]
MHPALLPNALSQLPPLMRRIANKAIPADGHLGDFMRFTRFFETASSDKLELFAPVLMVNLAGERMPSEYDFDPESPNWNLASNAVFRAHTSLRLLTTRNCIASLPSSSLRDVWERVWSWMHFTSTFHRLLGSLDGEELFSTHVQLIALLRRDPTTAELIDATTGARTIVARAVRFLFLYPEDNPEKWEFADGWQLLGDMKTEGTHHLDELLDGFSVPLSGLASLIVEHLELVNENLGVDDDEDSGIDSVASHIGSAYTQITEFSDSLTACLHSSGIVTTITTMLRIIVGRQTVFPILSDFLPILWDNLGGAAAPARMVEAINAGLLRILIIGAASLHSDESARTDIKELLESFLPGFTIYQSVLESIRDALPEADALASSAEFTTSSVAKHWASFRSLVRQRIAVLESYFAADFTLLQGCDGPECGKVLPRADTRRCSGCRSVHYCSRACQTAGWREDEDIPRSGWHRIMCTQLRLCIPTDPFTRRDRLFLQALVHHDYAEHRTEIAAKGRAALPDIDAPGFMLTFCVAMFDYTRGVLDISLRTWTQLDEMYTMAGGHDADEVLLQQTWIAAWGRMQTCESEVVVVRVSCGDGDDRTREQLVWVQARRNVFGAF